MGMRGLQIAQACAEESTDSGAPFLSRNEHALACQVASCRPQALAACALPDAGTLNSAQIKALDFRIYFAIIRSALAVYPRTPVNKTQRRKPLRFVILGLRPSADPWVYWVSLGEIGWKPGGRGGDWKLPELPTLAKIAGIETTGICGPDRWLTIVD